GAVRSLALLVEELHRGGLTNDDRIRSEIKALLDNDTPFRNLLATNAAGDVVYDGADVPNAFNIADREFFTVHRDSELGGRPTGMHISDLIRSRLGRGWFVAVSRRINAADGGFAGIAYAVIDLSHFERSYSDLDVGAAGFVTLWARGGKVLARTPRDPLLANDPGLYAERVARLRLPEPVAETFARSPLDGIDRWIIAREVDGLPLRVSVGLAEHEILANWEHGLPARAVASGGAMLIVVALTWVLLAYLERLESADAALRESERRSRALFDSTFEHIAMLSIDGSVLAANQSLQSLAESMDSGGVGEKFWTLAPWSISPGVQRQLREAVRRAAQGEFVRFESDMATADGVRTVDISIKPICDERGQAEQLIAEARDVTDRKRGEDSLRASEARVRSYFETAMDGIVVADRSGRFIDVNPAACRLFGFEREALTQLCFADLLPADCGPAVTAATHLAQVNTSGGYRGELRMRRADGAIRRAEVSAVRLEGDYYLGVFRDVTQQRQEAEALRTSNARIAALLRAIPDLALLMDSNSVYIDLATPPSDQRLMRAAKRLLGRRPADVLPVEVA
ncbi:MAG TPA: PAS domain-containing protein, partial [Azospirillaceae bacterium]|nr:PAS domain-containing protein [Azospirillaceae bacterium]